VVREGRDAQLICAWSADPSPASAGRAQPGGGTAQADTFHATMSWKEEKQMLWTIGVVLLVLWVLGLVGSYTLGGFIHVLLVVALIVFLIQVIQGRRV
jgi:hypothetical protein